jgi:hypothetical protein
MGAAAIGEGDELVAGTPREGRSMSIVTPESLYLKSSFYEQLVEHVFISEFLQDAWFRFGQAVEVLRSEVDASGYDVVLECNGIIRHVQLKTSGAESRTASQKVHVQLANKPSGCVVWLIRHRGDDHRLRLTYRYFGGGPGDPLPSLDGFRVAKHVKGDSQGVKKERPNIRVVPKGQFETILTTGELVERLFGLVES